MITDRFAAQARVLLAVVGPAAILMALVPSVQLVAGTALVALTAYVLVIAVAPAIPYVATPSRRRTAQSADQAPLCCPVAIPEDPIRPRAPGLV